MRDTHDKTFGVTLIGYGYSAKTFHAPLIGAVEGLDLGPVCSRDQAKVHADGPGVAVHPDPVGAAKSDGIDLVVVASPNDSHAPLARAALEAGKHVVVDKPFTLDLAVLAADRGRLLAVIHNRRWDGDFLTVRRAVEGGPVGRVTHFESHFDRFSPSCATVGGSAEARARASGSASGRTSSTRPCRCSARPTACGPTSSANATAPRPATGPMSCSSTPISGWSCTRACSSRAAHPASSSTVTRAASSGHGRTSRRRSSSRACVPVRRDGARTRTPLAVYAGDGASRILPAEAGDRHRYGAGIAAALSGSGPAAVSPLQAVGVMAVIEAATGSAGTGSSAEPSLSAEERAAWS